MTDDLVKRLRQTIYLEAHQLEGPFLVSNLQAIIERFALQRIEAADRIETLEAALETVMVGGNHLVQLIGTHHPHWTQEPCEALDWYGPNDAYDAWCCWKSIMQARAALGEKKDGEAV